MPGGLICEMGTFCVIYFFFLGVKKFLQGQRGCISITPIYGVLADFPGFPLA